MRDLPAALEARIDSGAACLCHVWILTRKDGRQLGFTDHDADLLVANVLCRAASGWTAGAAHSELGFAPGALAAQGVLDSDAVTEADIIAGLYDGAALELLRVDWTAPDLWVRLWRGTLSRLVREGERFTAEIDGPLAALDRVAGRSFGRLCDARLGDSRCRAVVPADAVCDKRFSTCNATFGNGLNFQGFPHIPGDDFLTLYPAEGARHDGGSRRA